MIRNCQGAVLRMFAVYAAVALWTPAQEIRPAFEVASIKPNTSASGDSSTRGTKGQIVFTNQTLKRLVERAYNVKPFQVTGPEWMQSASFDITAKFPTDASNEERAGMLRTLLEERFSLAVHHETKETHGFALVKANSGFKLKPVEPGGSSTNSNGGRVRTLTAKKTSMAFLADLLARNLGELVVDKTGIEGVYDFELRWANTNPGADGNGDDSAPSLFTAIQESLGLRLQPQKVPMDVIVVDHMERTPTEN